MTVNTLRKLAATLNVTTDYIVNGTLPTSSDTELALMLMSMPEQARQYAEKILTICNEAFLTLQEPPRKATDI